jgi:hypothetical protein
MKVKFHRLKTADFYSHVADRPHPDSYTQWGQVTHAEIAEYLDLLKDAKSERPMQAFFCLHRHFLVEHLRGGHGRWVIPQLRLGSQHVTDFMIGAANSFGADWVAVELESPRAHLFTKAGNPTAILIHAIRQITDWRVWLRSNLAYAAKPEGDDGLGLAKIRSDVEGLILIGRRSTLSDSDNTVRDQMYHDMNIAIHTYDYIADVARDKAAMLDKHSKRQKAKT